MIRISDLPANVQHFFNTINLEGLELLKSIADSRKQEDIVYHLFAMLPHREMTPFMVLNILLSCKYIHEKTPITSIRRVITNLTEAGLLIKTDNKVMEEYGKPNYTWKLNIPEKKQIQTKLF